MMMQKVDGRYRLSGSNKDNRTFYAPREIFEYQANRCGVEYFDYFMLHNVAEGSYNTYTDEDLGIIDAMLKLKAEGRIHKFGFSSHGRAGTIERFILHTKERYGDIFDFAMIQLNYMDWVLQKANEKYDVLTRHKLPVIVMEPLRGGTLARLNEKADAILKAARPHDSQASWAFRFLQSLDNVAVVLSGMNSMAQLEENLAIFSKHEPTTQEENAVLHKVLESLVDLIPCTDCKYCVDECPQKLDIPMLLTMYNEAGFDIGWYLRAALGALKDSEKPGVCTSCGNCNPLCPQGIDIPEALKKFNALIN
jgi:hypothetical protein